MGGRIRRHMPYCCVWFRGRGLHQFTVGCVEPNVLDQIEKWTNQCNALGRERCRSKAGDDTPILQSAKKEGKILALAFTALSLSFLICTTGQWIPLQLQWWDAMRSCLFFPGSLWEMDFPSIELWMLLFLLGCQGLLQANFISRIGTCFSDSSSPNSLILRRFQKGQRQQEVSLSWKPCCLFISLLICSNSFCVLNGCCVPVAVLFHHRLSFLLTWWPCETGVSPA